MKRIVIEINTAVEMGADGFVRSSFREWYGHPNPKLRPDRFGSVEPARRKFSEEGIEPAIEIWLNTGLTPVIKRVAAPKFDCSFDWRRNAGIGRLGTVPWKGTVRIYSKIGTNLLLELLGFLVSTFRPAFGSVAPEDEREALHKIRYPAYGGIAEKFVGLEVGKLLPGIYWSTYFGSQSIEQVGGRHRLAEMKIGQLYQMGEGLAVVAFPKADDWSSEASRKLVMNIRKWRGKGNFFDKQQYIDQMNIQA